MSTPRERAPRIAQQYVDSGWPVPSEVVGHLLAELAGSDDVVAERATLRELVASGASGPPATVAALLKVLDGRR